MRYHAIAINQTMQACIMIDSSDGVHAAAKIAMRRVADDLWWPRETVQQITLGLNGHAVQWCHECTSESGRAIPNESAKGTT